MLNPEITSVADATVRYTSFQCQKEWNLQKKYRPLLFFGPCIFNNEDKNKPTKCTK